VDKIEKVKQHASENTTLQELIVLTGLSYNDVYGICRKHKFPFNKESPSKRIQEQKREWMEKNFALVLQLSSAGASAMEISKEYNLNYHYVRKCILESGQGMLKQGTSKSSRAKQKEKRKTNDGLTKEVFIRLHFEEQISSNQIRKMFNITHSTLKILLDEWGVIARNSADGTRVFTSKDAYKQKMRELANEGVVGVFRMHLDGKYYDTGIELTFERWCVENMLYYVKQFQIRKGGHRYDFYLPHFNLIVECDGLYFHSQEKQILKDIKHSEDATKNGFGIIRLTCEEINDGRFEQIVRQRIDCFDKAKGC